MKDLNRLIGPVPLADAHVLSPLPSVHAVVDHLERKGTDPKAPIWFFERIQVDQVDPTALVHQPTPVQRAQVTRLRATVGTGANACAVLEHAPALPVGRGQFRIVDGDLALTAAYTGDVEQVLAWVAHTRSCCEAGSPTPRSLR